MKIAVATNKGGLEDEVSTVFGRCSTFTMVIEHDNEIKNSDVVENPGFSAAGGAGIQAAQYISDQKAEVVISGNFGPNASGVLNQTGVKMVQAQGKVDDVIHKYLKGELKNIDGPSVSDHFGAGRRRFGGGCGRGRRGGI